MRCEIAIDLTAGGQSNQNVLVGGVAAFMAQTSASAPSTPRERIVLFRPVVEPDSQTRQQWLRGAVPVPADAVASLEYAVTRCGVVDISEDERKVRPNHAVRSRAPHHTHINSCCGPIDTLSSTEQRRWPK